MPYQVATPPGASKPLERVIAVINFLRTLSEEVEHEVADPEDLFIVTKRRAPLNRIVVMFLIPGAPIKALEETLRQAGIEPTSSGPRSLYFGAYPK